MFYIYFMCICWFYEWVQSQCTEWIMLKHTSFTVWLNLYILPDHIILLCSLWVSLVFICWQSQGVVHITVYFFYCSPEHHSSHRRSQQLQESYAKKLPCSEEQQKKDPAHHSAAKYTFLSLSISIISYSWSIMCRMLHTLSFNIWWYVSGLYDILSLKLQQITSIHETLL